MSDLLSDIECNFNSIQNNIKKKADTKETDNKRS